MALGKETFSNRIKRIMAENTPCNITGGLYKGNPYYHICKELSSNFIDGTVTEFCNIKGDIFRRKIKYHQYSNHLNSSQIMCISFFKKFFEKEGYDQILIDVLRRSGVAIAQGVSIINAIFEYEPDRKERTNFDFYMIMSDSQRISFEIKYTESEFGGISKDKNDPDKYKRKWAKIYSVMVNESPYLHCNMDEFYKNYHYQINRNIAYATAGDQVVFLTPKANDDNGIVEGRKYIDDMHGKYSCIMNLYWEDIYAVLMDKIEDQQLRDYYQRFGEKYIKILNM